MTQDITVELVGAPDERTRPIWSASHRRSGARSCRSTRSTRWSSRSPARLPKGRKAVDVAQIGALIVAAAPGVAALTKIIDTVRGWFTNRRATEPSAAPLSLKITIGDKSIEITADRKEQQDAGRSVRGRGSEG